MDITDGLQGTNSNMTPDLGSGQAADTHTTNEVATLTAQLAEAMTVVRALQQQNKELGSVNADIALQMRDMWAQMQEEQAEMRRFMSGEMPKYYSPPKRQREMETVEARVGASAHAAENVRTGNEGVSGGFQDRMTDEDDTEEGKVIFTNQTGTRYSPKPLYTNASSHTFMSAGKRRSYAHLSLVENLDFIPKGRQGSQAIRARLYCLGGRKGMGPGPAGLGPRYPQRLHANSTTQHKACARGSRTK
jgi:hypothetical protein